jgi:hypothetical protein
LREEERELQALRRVYIHSYQYIYNLLEREREKNKCIYIYIYSFSFSFKKKTRESEHWRRSSAGCERLQALEGEKRAKTWGVSDRERKLHSTSGTALAGK